MNKLNFFRMKNRNNIRLLLGTLMLLFTVTSCQDFLDEQPPSSITDAQFWKNNADIELGVTAIYDAMQVAYQRKYFYWGEFRSDNFVTAPGSSEGEFSQLINNTLTPQFSESLQWDELYRMIMRANLAIEKIPTIAEYNANALGEAYAARAYAYFDAYRIWGGVPIFTKVVSELGDEAYRPQSTPAQVLALVLSDLAQAEKLLTTQTHRYRFSVSSILLFKAKLLMHENRYAEAKVVLDKFMASNVTIFKFSLTTNRDAWTKLFTMATETGPELIFSLRATLAEDGNNVSQHNGLFNSGVPPYFISPKVIAKWQAKFPIDKAGWEAKYPGIDPPKDAAGNLVYGDWRYWETLFPKSTTNLDPDKKLFDNAIGKYHKVSGNSLNDDTDIIVYRYADVLLLKAEVENRLGDATAALALVNLVRVARQMPVAKTTDFVNFNDKEEVENFIMDERQFELYAEGDRWWDLLRTQKAVQVMGPINGQTADKLLWPVYFEHRNDNKKLNETPGYGN